MSASTQNLLTVLYMALVLDAALIAAPAAVTWWRLKDVPDFKYFKLRAGITCVAHIAEGISLIFLVVLRSEVSLWVLLIVWQAGELAKVVGESMLAGNLYGILNGVHPTAPVETIAAATQAMQEAERPNPPAPPSLPGTGNGPT